MEHTGPHELTTVEVREKFLRHIWDMIGIWENTTQRDTVREKMEGLAFSILAMLDGEAVEFPGFIVAPIPHKDAEKFHKERGENWFPRAKDCKQDIAGSLHDQFYYVKRDARKP